MIVDARSLPPDSAFQADLCIIGAGPAGLAVAHRFLGSRHRICIVESGGLAFEPTSQPLSRGLSVGLPYEALDLCRVRQFGGSTGRAGWGGWCKVLDPEDFEEKPWLKLSGWPIPYEELEAYYASAARFLGIDSLSGCSAATGPWPPGGPLYSEQCFLSPDPDLGQRFFEPFRSAENICVVVHATVLKIRTDPGGHSVHALEVAGTRTKRFSVGARAYVLAGGGIENARLLLASRDACPAGLGNTHDQVGRHFMEHPRVSWGSLRSCGGDAVASHFDPALGKAAVRRATRTAGLCAGAYGIAVKRDVRDRERLLHSRTWIKPCAPGGYGEGAQALQYIAFWLRKGRPHRHLLPSVRSVLRNPVDAGVAAVTRALRKKTGHFRFETVLEQDPDPASRVTLGARTDRFGVPVAVLDWRVTPLVRDTLGQVQKMIVQEMTRLGHVCLIESPADRGRIAPDPSYGWVRHHMGTTRMSADSRTGVVDGSCRVHGVSNLYVAGCSVFPTGGNDMPTLTIVGLGLRLGAHIEQLMALSAF